MPERIVTATTPGPVVADLVSDNVDVEIVVDPTARIASVALSTTDTRGPSADVVRDTTVREYVAPDGTTVWEIRLPQGPSGTDGCHTTVTVGGVTVTGTGSVSMIGGDIYIGGHRVVTNGRPTATRADTGEVAPVTVTVTLPGLSSARTDTRSAGLRARGPLRLLDATSVSGRVHVESAHTMRARTSSGSVHADLVAAGIDVETISGRVGIGAAGVARARTSSGSLHVGRVLSEADVSSISGRIRVDAHSGDALTATTTSGSIEITATPVACGTLALSSVSGRITTHGTAHLDVRARSTSGRVATA